MKGTGIWTWSAIAVASTAYLVWSEGWPAILAVSLFGSIFGALMALTNFLRLP